MYQLAMYPRNVNHIIGILGMNFLHANLEHLTSNFLPLAISLYGIFYFYKDISGRVLIISMLSVGVLIWLFARPSFHIGASGLLYALVFFVLVGGLIRKNKQLLIFAFITLTFQSGLIWGIFPQDNQISWESHLMGAIVGIVLSFIYRKKGPQKDPKHQWSDDEDSASGDEYKELLDND